MGDTFSLDVVFAQRVARFISYDPSTRKYDTVKARMFSDKVGISITTILTWVKGTSPSPMSKNDAEEFLDSYVEQP